MQEAWIKFVAVRSRNPIHLLCALAFAVVLLHSAVPHSHHCGSGADHIHIRYSCQQLADCFMQPAAISGCAHQSECADLGHRSPDPATDESRLRSPGFDPAEESCTGQVFHRHPDFRGPPPSSNANFPAPKLFL